MRIVIVGQQAFGKAVLEAFIMRGDQVAGVFAAPERPGARPDPLVVTAQERGLTVHRHAKYSSDEAKQALAELNADLAVMAYVTLFVPEEFLKIPSQGSIQYHPSLLPKFRGPSSINWPIIKGETETGLSIFWPDNGLDTGDILLQKKTPISPDDTLGSVYFDRLFPMGVEATLEAVDLVKAGKAQRVKQDESRASYEGWCSADNSRIDWGKPWAQIYNLIRGSNPQPGAWTVHDGKKLQIFDSKPLPAKQPSGIAGKMGEVVAIDAESFTVACADGRIRVLRVKAADGGKVGAAEFASTAKLAAGARLT